MLIFHVVASIVLVAIILLLCQFVSELARVAAPGMIIIVA